MRRGLRVCLLGAVCCALSGQGNSERYQPLVQALGLTDAQMSQLLHPSTADQFRTGVLDARQQLQLAEIAKVMERWNFSGGAVVMGLIDARAWPPGGWPCGLYPVAAYTKEFDLSDAQSLQLQQLVQVAQQPGWQRMQEPNKRRQQLIQAGASSDSPEVKALNSEVSELMKQAMAIRPSREAALAVLNDAQKARLAAFEADLELANEAIQLHLIRSGGVPEILCH